MVSKGWRLAAALSLFFASHGAAMGQNVADKTSRIWKTPADGVEVLAATFFGGRGDEWLAAGGFQPDGGIVVVGNVLGSSFDVPAKVDVIGQDLPKVSDPQPIPILDKGSPKLDKSGKPQFEKPSWRHDGVTAFVALYSPDMKTLKSVHRLPWGAGAATAATVGKDGAIYIAGRATDGIAKLGGNVAELPALPPGKDKDRPRCAHSFVAKLTPDASKAVWVRHVRGPSNAPMLELTDDNQLRFGAGQMHVLDLDGKLLSTRVVPGGVRTLASINPITNEIATGGEHHWQTGREPWRCPTLNVYNSDGTQKHQLYDWGGPYVGLDNIRQVSDTAVRYVAHDRDGSIILYLWSDGGNSVAVTEPFDVRQRVVPKGLGMTTAGAGVLSCAYIIRLDPKDYRVTAWTLWLANNSNGKPNSVWIEQIARVPDRSLAFAGNSAWGLWQTKDKLTDAEPTGQYIALLNEDFSGLRYSSIIPGAGAAEVTDGTSARGSGWAIASGTVNGKSRVLYLTGATEGSMQNDKLVPAAVRNAAQAKFAGGRSDGYAVLLELAPPTTKPVVAEAKIRTGPTLASFEALKGRDPKKTPNKPDDGAVFHFTPKYPKWVTVDAEIRDQSGKRWPIFMSGRPISGTLTFHDAAPTVKDLTVACTTVCQPNEDPNQRVLGSLFSDPKNTPPLTLTLDSIGAAKSQEIKITSDKGKTSSKTLDYHEARGTLDFAGKKMPVSPKVTIAYNGPRNGPIEGVAINAYLTLRGSDLGVSSNDLVDVRIGMSGTLRTEAPPKKK